MNTVLVSNIAVYGLVIAGLTIVPMLPGMIMKRVLADGLAAERPTGRSSRR
jgi:hypothetical protein